MVGFQAAFFRLLGGFERGNQFFQQLVFLFFLLQHFFFVGKGEF